MIAPLLKPIISYAGPDAAILAAFERIRAYRAWTYSFDDLADDQKPEAAIEAAENEVLADENQIWGATAQTIEGVICRLALTVPDLDQARWVERLLVSEGISALIEKRDELEGNARQIVIAIDHLQQIATSTRSAPSDEPHLVWLAQYLNARAILDDTEVEEETAEYEAACSIMNQLEEVILAVPARSQDALIAKLFILARVNADGASPITERSEALVREAEAVFGFKGMRHG